MDMADRYRIAYIPGLLQLERSSEYEGLQQNVLMSHLNDLCRAVASCELLKHFKLAWGFAREHRVDYLPRA